jgi:hypothetical protein
MTAGRVPAARYGGVGGEKKKHTPADYSFNPRPPKKASRRLRHNAFLGNRAVTGRHLPGTLLEDRGRGAYLPSTTPFSSVI